MTALAEWCASEGMPIAYHHHMAAPIETELDQLMKHSGEALSLLYDAGQYGVHLRCTRGEGNFEVFRSNHRVARREFPRRRRRGAGRCRRQWRREINTHEDPIRPLYAERR